MTKTNNNIYYSLSEKKFSTISIFPLKNFMYKVQYFLHLIYYQLLFFKIVIKNILITLQTINKVFTFFFSVIFSNNH